MGAIPKLDDNRLQVVCDALADTSTGLTGAEIGQLLQGCQVSEPRAHELRRSPDRTLMWLTAEEPEKTFLKRVD